MKRLKRSIIELTLIVLLVAIIFEVGFFVLSMFEGTISYTVAPGEMPGPEWYWNLWYMDHPFYWKQILYFSVVLIICVIVIAYDQLFEPKGCCGLSEMKINKEMMKHD